jgi:tetratricopeptide (TPR) repeat protein
MLGDIYLSPLHAAECYKQALRLEPDNGEAAYELAKIALYHRKDARAARRFVPRFIRALPEGAEWLALDLAVDIYKASDMPDAARKARRRASWWRRRLSRDTVSELDPHWNESRCARIRRALNKE